MFQKVRVLMFTGLVEGRGQVAAITSQGTALELAIGPPQSIGVGGAAIGDSVALNGCCLTVVENAQGVWKFQAGEETLSKTSLGRLRVGSSVNVERALPAEGRLGGHFVQGHVDGTGTVQDIQSDGLWTVMRIRIDPSLARFLVSKGSVAMDGVSLTVVDAHRDSFSVALIPHTLEVTTLGERAIGDVLNLETDILGKYVARFLEVGRAG